MVDDGQRDLSTRAPGQLGSLKSSERRNGLGVDRSQLSVGGSPCMRFVDCVGQSETDIGENLPWLLGAQNDDAFRHIAASLGFAIQFGERSRWLVPRSGADVRVPPNAGNGAPLVQAKSHHRTHGSAVDSEFKGEAHRADSRSEVRWGSGKTSAVPPLREHRAY